MVIYIISKKEVKRRKREIESSEKKLNRIQINDESEDWVQIKWKLQTSKKE